MSKLNPIETARLSLEPWRLADRDEFDTIRTHPTVCLGGLSAGVGVGVGSNITLDHWLKEAEGLPPGLGAWAIRDGARAVVGEVALRPCVWDRAYVEIRCGILGDCSEHGFAREAMGAILRYGTGLVGLSEILALVTAEDRRSVQLVKELGFHLAPALASGQASGQVYTYQASESLDVWEPIGMEPPFPSRGTYWSKE